MISSNPACLELTASDGDNTKCAPCCLHDGCIMDPHAIYCKGDEWINNRCPFSPRMKVCTEERDRQNLLVGGHGVLVQSFCFPTYCHTLLPEIVHEINKLKYHLSATYRRSRFSIKWVKR